MKYCVYTSRQSDGQFSDWFCRHYAPSAYQYTTRLYEQNDNTLNTKPEDSREFVTALWYSTVHALNQIVLVPSQGQSTILHQLVRNFCVTFATSARTINELKLIDNVDKGWRSEYIIVCIKFYLHFIALYTCIKWSIYLYFGGKETWEICEIYEIIWNVIDNISFTAFYFLCIIYIYNVTNSWNHM